MSDGAHRRWTLSDWQEMFEEIYGHRNKASNEVYIWFRLLEEIGELVKETRYKNRDGIKYHLPDVLAWIYAFCLIKGFDLSQIVLERYKEGCPWCKQEKCICPPGKLGYTSVESNKKPKKTSEKTTPQLSIFNKSEWTLGDWEVEFEKIYGDRNDQLEWLQVAARLTEQAGDVAKIIRQRQETELLKQRVADVFAWTIAVFNSLKATGLSGDIQFADLVFNKYPNWCPKCHLRPCKCPSPIVKVFISSVMSETTNERSLAKQVLEEERFTPVMFEDFKGQFFFDQEAEAIKNLQESDLLLLILDKTLTSSVFTEFYSAISLDKPVLIFLKDRIEPVSEELQKFLTNVGRKYKYERFRDDQNDFRYKLLTEIRRLRQ